jgi:hypothetical protein
LSAFILVLEARVGHSGIQWLFRTARFSDMNLGLDHKSHELWISIHSDEKTFNHDAGTGIASTRTRASLS